VRGKKWYWETAGITIFDQPEPLPFFDVKQTEKGKPIGWLTWFEHSTDGVKFGYRLEKPDLLLSVKVIAIKDGWQLRIYGDPKLAGIGPKYPRCDYLVESHTIDPDGFLNADAYFRWNKPIARKEATVEPKVSKTARRLPAMAGYEVTRLPLDDQVMPTAIAFINGKPMVASLKGGLYEIEGDSKYRRFGDYLSAPFGLLVEGDTVVVAHRHELLRIKGRGIRSDVMATGWGVSADYHEWAVGPVCDAAGNYYLSLSCQEDDRPAFAARGRGKVLRIRTDGTWTEYAAGLRYAMGIVANKAGDLFVTDNQGVTNPFNELNHIRRGRHYGFFNKLDSLKNPPAETLPAIQIPHPWTRSVNGVAMIPEGFGPFAGQMVGADYTTRKLIRISLQQIGDTYQGAAYPFSRDDSGLISRDETFLGPIAVAFGPDGCLYVGSLIDSGWGGGNNRGAIERVKYVGPVPFGVREVRAHPSGFTLDFTSSVDASLAAKPEQYSLSCYRRIHHGGYETPDQDQTLVTVEKVEVSADRRSVKLFVRPLRPTFVYDIGIGGIDGAKEKPFPAVAHYTLNEVPKE
jgi:glucose/arabinose dehydrogenase